MVSEKARDVIRHLQAVISDDYSQNARKLEYEIGRERYNETVDYLTSNNILKSLKFESGKYRIFLENQPDRKVIQDMIDILEKEEIMKDSNKKLNAFISYSTIDKELAGKLKELLTECGIESFLAHEDIEPSKEWLNEIKENLKNSILFFCILSKDFLSSPYCIQETGMADILNKPIMPLSIDGSIPPGFISRIQSKKLNINILN